MYISVYVSELREYCHWETFQTSCGPGEMIVIREAMYGRMKIGRCVKEDFGYIGCGKNVTNQLHSLCSGRRECEFPVTLLHGNHHCSNDLTAYLVADLDCVKGKFTNHIILLAK